MGRGGAQRSQTFLPAKVVLRQDGLDRASEVDVVADTAHGVMHRAVVAPERRSDLRGVTPARCALAAAVSRGGLDSRLIDRSTLRTIRGLPTRLGGAQMRL